MSIDIIKQDGDILAVIAKTAEINDSLKFISPENFPMQVGIHNKNSGITINAHEHFPFKNVKSLDCQEIFYISKGKAEVGLYHHGKKVKRVTLLGGDLIILNTGHDLKFLEDTKLIEVKQGPYRGKENEKKEIK
jgi:hypothetical protein